MREIGRVREIGRDKGREIEREKRDHQGEKSHRSEISAEWCIRFVKPNRLYENGFILSRGDLTSTQVRSHLGWDDLYPCKKFLLSCPIVFCSYYVIKCSLSYKT